MQVYYFFYVFPFNFTPLRTITLTHAHAYIYKKGVAHDTIKKEKQRYLLVFKRKLTIFILCALAAVGARAQYDVNFAHYFDMEPSFNAASVGKESKLNIVGAYAMNLVGFENNPQTMYAAADMPLYFLKSYHGVGLQLMNDKIGLFTHQRLSLQYAYRFRLFGGRLAVGAQLGMLSESLDGSKADLEEADDDAFSSSESNGSGFDIGAGLYYQHGPWYVGLSALHLNAPLIELGETNELKIDPSYYFTGGYNIRLRSPFLTIKPSVFVRTDMVAYRVDLTGRLVYTHDKKMMYGGLSYSPDNSVTFLLGGSFHGAVIGYSYEYYTSAIKPGNGSHELFIGYQTDINLTKKGKNKHQSVRIL